jgi:hypothetical protein
VDKERYGHARLTKEMYVGLASNELEALQRQLEVSEHERCKLMEELKPLRREHEEVVLQIMATLDELMNGVVGGTNIFTAYDPSGTQVAVPAHHIEGILEAVRHEFKKHEQFNYLDAAEQRAIHAVQEAKQWREKYETLAARRFPIMNDGYAECPSSIPWFVAERYDRQMQRNHSQSVEKLAERGGLDPTELWFCVQSKDYDNNEPNLVEKSVALVKKFNGLDIEWYKLYDELLAHHREVHSQCQF